MKVIDDKVMKTPFFNTYASEDDHQNAMESLVDCLMRIRNLPEGPMGISLDAGFLLNRDRIRFWEVGKKKYNNAVAVKDVALVNEHVKLRASLNGEDYSFHISGEGDMGSAFSDWEKDSEDLIKMEAEDLRAIVRRYKG